MMPKSYYHKDYLANVSGIEEFGRDPYLLEGDVQPQAIAPIFRLSISQSSTALSSASLVYGRPQVMHA